MALPLLALYAAGAVTQAYGAYSQSKQEQKTLEYNQRILKANEAVNQASIQFDKMRAKREAESFLGQQRAAISKSGVTMGGSALDVMLDSLEEISLNLFSYELESMKSAAMTKSEIENLELQKEQSQKAAYISMLSSAVGGATSIAEGGK